MPPFAEREQLPPFESTHRFAPDVGGGGGAAALADEGRAHALRLRSLITQARATTLHAPVHPRNRQPDFGWAFSRTVAPSATRALHVVAHEMRLGELTTVPWPMTTTVSVTARDERTAAALPVTDEQGSPI